VFVRSTPVGQTGNKMASPAGAMTSRTVAAHRRLSGSCPRMDSICEGSEEGSTSSSEGETTASTSGSLSASRKLAPTRSNAAENRQRAKMNARMSFPPAQKQKASHVFPQLHKTAKEVASCRVSKFIETGTNTSSVELHDKSTSTDGMSSALVDGKMAECISKLRTVRQRLEQQQPLTPPRNSSPPDSTPDTPPQPISEQSPSRISADSAPITVSQPISGESCPPKISPDSSHTFLRQSVNESKPVTQPEPSIDNPSPPKIPSQATLPPGDTRVTLSDVVEQSCGHKDEAASVQQFISELKSRTLQQQDTSPSADSKLPVQQQTVPGRRSVAVDRRRTAVAAAAAGNLSRHDQVVESSPSSSPRTRRSNPPPSSAVAVFQRSYSPRAPRTRTAPTGSAEVGSPILRRSAAALAAKKLSVVSSPPTMRSPGRQTKKQTAKVDLTTPVGPSGSKSPSSSPNTVRPARTPPAATRKQLATIDDEQV